MSFRRNPFLERQLRRQAEHQRMKVGAAEKIARAASSIAPVVTGDYSDSFRVAEEGDMVAATSDDIASVALEFGGRTTPTHATLRRAVGTSGFRFKDTGG